MHLLPPQVKDDSNFDFLIKLLSKIGASVPPASYVESALGVVAQEHHLLGEDASTSVVEAD